MKHAYVDILKTIKTETKIISVLHTHYGYTYNGSWDIYKETDYRMSDDSFGKFSIVHKRLKFCYAKFNTLKECTSFLSSVNDTWFDNVTVDNTCDYHTLIWHNESDRYAARDAYLCRMSLIDCK